MPEHKHRWKLTNGNRAEGKCRCGARKTFTGGVDGNALGFGTVTDPSRSVYLTPAQRAADRAGRARDVQRR